MARDSKVRRVKKGILIYPAQEKTSTFGLKDTYSYDYDEQFSFELWVVSLNTNILKR